MTDFKILYPRTYIRSITANLCMKYIYLSDDFLLLYEKCMYELLERPQPLFSCNIKLFLVNTNF